MAKPRINGAPSSLPPVPGAPSWAIKRGCQTTPTSSRTTRQPIRRALPNSRNVANASSPISVPTTMRSNEQYPSASGTPSQRSTHSANQDNACDIPTLSQEYGSLQSGSEEEEEWEHLLNC
ncbi:uncharacterized protein [Dysidea avara]|uniref:uncharacterized protein isoform X2 n=1 Tax=Dysidea avara TaxID=196820 RepID=UPI00332A56AA